MKSIAQLFRQPLKTLSGILLVALAVAILCVCVGQAAAAANMRSSLEESYVTAAIPNNKYQDGQYPQEVLDWIDTAVEEQPDLILKDSYAGLASAYIPRLHPDNYTDYLAARTHSGSDASLAARSFGAPYTCAMLEVTLTGAKVVSQGEESTIVELRGTIDRVIGLEEGYADPTGFTAIMTMNFKNYKEWEAVESQYVVGERYLVYGTDYVDEDYYLRSAISSDFASNASGNMAVPGADMSGISLERFDPEYLTYFYPEEEWDTLLEEVTTTINGATVTLYTGVANVAYYSYWYEKADGTKDYKVKCFTAYQMRYSYNKVSFTLQDMPRTISNGTDNSPAIVHLEGTAEEFLASEEGALWQEALDNLKISNQSFPVVGVDDLMYIAGFAKQDALIVEGRDFTDDELTSGAGVCVISRLLAEQNGLRVGNTITARYFDPDTDSSLNPGISENRNIINSTASYFTPGASFAGEPVTYTIVGLYEQNAIWGQTNNSLYAFTPNTIFVPKASVTADMDYSYMGMYRTLVLPNGAVDDFELLLEASNKAGLFTCYDQGYEELSNNLYSYESIADQAVKVGLVVYAVVIALYFILFPTRQGKVIATMASLGATRREKLRHVNVSGLGILLPGTLLGLTAGILLRHRVIEELTSAAEVVLPLEMDVGVLAWMSVLQFAAAVLVTFLISLPLTRNQSLMKRRSLTESIRQLRKVPLNTWVVMVFALLISLILCALNASNEAEQENFETARKEIPVTVTVMNLQGDKSTDLNLDGWVASVFSGSLDWGFHEYLTDIRLEYDQEIETINGEPADRNLNGMMSVGCAPELLPITNSSITWREGYDESIFETADFVCIVPEGYDLDADPDTPEQELDLYFYWEDITRDSMGAIIDQINRPYSCTMTVVGTYVSSLGATDIYCPYLTADTISAKIGVARNLGSAGAALADNDRLEDFRIVARRFFLEPGSSSTAIGSKKYSLEIDTSALNKAEAVLNNSITINRISTLLVFVLSAGAGFFLGFLMIRSRKREIILMRTLGKPNGSIYLDFVAEQMLRILLGTAIGGAVFFWQPVGRLVLFVLVYFVGLSAALLLFLNSKLITNMKEDE